MDHDFQAIGFAQQENDEPLHSMVEKQISRMQNRLCSLRHSRSSTMRYSPRNSSMPQSAEPSRPSLGISPKRTTQTTRQASPRPRKHLYPRLYFTHFIEVALTNAPNDADDLRVGKAHPGLPLDQATGINADTEGSIRKTNDGPLLYYVEVVIHLAIPYMVHSGICKRGSRVTPEHHRKTRSKAMSKDRLIRHFIIQGRSVVPGTALLLLQEAAT
ncbi:uncharacterized protein CLUP02_18080 [Colletotrichum lupini]|uniref:Uncharacterized protein n=1 Tax=Colletotrichum lupini TaxID=145971 RepID=A0A9Q8WBE5_9PEZI|nr:uncharacterized protein CLUP02_18080 [Colletotrichum lupini]UQC76567.1 hypothetical protein CLUP02_18080 [Colletotrichum lupini]